MNAAAWLPQRWPAAMRYGALVMLIFCWLAATGGWRRFTAPDEGRYAGVAYEMLRSGDWLVPRLDGLPFFHKPPLFYWISASAMSVFGASEWPARLPSLLGATATASGLLLFVQRWVDGWSAAKAVVVLITMPFFYVGAQFANLDMLVAGCITLTILLAAHAALLDEAGCEQRAALTGAFAFAALGVLAKGMIGVVLPGAVFVLWCIAVHRIRAAKLLVWWPGWLVFLALAAPWFVVMQLRYPAFFDYFVVTQHFRRFAGTGFNNAQPFWFYLPVIALLTLPWMGWLLKGAVDRRRGLLPATDLDWLMAIWFVVVLLFFSVPRSKLVGYVLPTLPPFAWFVMRVLGQSGIGKLPRWTTIVGGATCLAGVIAAGAFGTPPSALLRLPSGFRIGPDDQVVMLNTYFYEIPFYWKLAKPVAVLGPWKDPNLPHQDNWHKELADSGSFEPERAARVLVDWGDASALLCAERTSWIVGSSASALFAPWLNHPGFTLVAHNDKTAVWRFVGTRNPQCLSGQTPARTTPVGAPE
ncbi:MAG: glycosyltransferase family 39 protein [Variovorax sp.]